MPSFVAIIIGGLYFGTERYRIEVGNNHGVRPGNIVGAIANEAGLDSELIGHIAIHDDHSFIDLPENMPADVFRDMKNIWVSGQRLMISRPGEAPANADTSRQARPAKAKPAADKDSSKRSKKPGAKKAGDKPLKKKRVKLALGTDTKKKSIRTKTV